MATIAELINLPKVVTIPLQSKENEFIEIPLDDLPGGSDVSSLLEQEKPKPSKGVELGLAYYREKRFEEFSQIFEIVGAEAALNHRDVENDQMAALDCLAAYSVREGSKARTDKERRKTHFARATLLYTTADKIQMYDQNHLAGRAYFCLVEGKGQKLEQAAQQFTFVLKQNENDIAAMMGMACINFNRREYKNALYYYKKCLKTKPDGPADFRVGIGMCLARMNQMEKARYAFERALEIDPQNVSALVALAVLDESEHTSESLQSSIQRLGLAYKLEPEHPVVLVNLANHFFYRREYSRVEHLGLHALTCADSDAIKAEACFQLARCYHAQNDFEKAFKYYYQATTLNQQNYILPYYGLGQLHIQRDEIPQAITAFQNILKASPNCTDSMKVLGCLYAESKKEPLIQQARELLTKYLQTYPEDTEILIELAQLLEHSDPNKSLQMYEKAVKIITKSGEEIPPEITNNIASLCMSQGKLEEALGMYKEAEEKLIEIINNRQGTVLEQEMIVTVRYNIARCMEQLCLYDEAEKRYKDILKEHPNYFDCVIRLGCVARDRGQVYDASMMFKEAISIDPTAEDPWLLIGLLHMTKNELGPAQKKFEHVIKMKDGYIAKYDSFTHVALGNVWTNSLFAPLREKINDQKFYDRAIMMYTRALKIQPKNMWAANGLGCILAHKKLWQEARDVFSQVREATSEFCDVWVNIANIYMETKQYVPAIQMYLNAMRKFGKERDPYMLLSLARAYFCSGKLKECRETLEKNMIESPDNIQVKFNYAFVLKKMAKRILEDTKATSVMVNGAIADLRTAERIFTYIHRNRDETLTNVKLISRSGSGGEGKQCQDLLKQAETYLARALEQDRIEEETRRKQEAERASLMQKILQQKQEKEDRAKARQDEILTMRTAFKEMTRDCLRMPEIKEDEKKSRGSGGGRRRKGGEGDEFVNDSSDMGDWQGGEGEEGGERRRKEKSSKKAARKRREKKVIIGSGTDDEAEKPSKKRKKFEKEVKLSAKQSAKIKSRAFLSSESESSDGPAPEPPSFNMEDSPPPAIRSNSTDSDSSAPKLKLKKKADSDEFVSDSDVPMKNGSDSDEPSTSKPVASSSNSESDTPKKRKKKAVSSSEDADSD